MTTNPDERSRTVVMPEPEPPWEQIADHLAEAFRYMRGTVGAAVFPALPGCAWYEAVIAYEKKKFPLKEGVVAFDAELGPRNINKLYPGRGGR